jgi:hypothetical protein
MEGRWEYIDYAVADIRQGAILQLGALDEVLTTPQNKNLTLYGPPTKVSEFDCE